jgi:hypothetical protein
MGTNNAFGDNKAHPHPLILPGGRCIDLIEGTVGMPIPLFDTFILIVDPSISETSLLNLKAFSRMFLKAYLRVF